MHEMCKYVKENQDPKEFNNIKCLQNELNSIIDNNKQNHYSRLSNKLIDPMTSSKVYWSTLKMFLNNNKIPCIPSLSHQNKYVTDFKEKAEIFNSFFPEQCSFLNNSNKLLSAFLKRTEKVISSISLSSNDIAKIIWDLDPNEAHGHNMISIRMLKICGEPISKLLEIIFKSCIRKGRFPSEWKKVNVVPVDKKGDKQVSISYRPVSLLQIWGKIFERLLFDICLSFLLAT